MATLDEAQVAKRPNSEYHLSENTTSQSPEIANIDVQGALITNDDPSSPTKLDADGAQHVPSIQLPNHKGVVSHVALDVGVALV